MNKCSLVKERRLPSVVSLVAIGMTCIAIDVIPARGQTLDNSVIASVVPAKARPADTPDSDSRQTQITIPPGTILPVRLRTTLCPEKLKPGQAVRGEIAQDVPLPGKAKIHKGSRVEGHVVEVAPASNGGTARVSIRFDKLYWQEQAVPTTTDLRALAGFMEVQEAGIPDTAPGEGDDGNWVDTTQIGGEGVYGVGGPVTSAEDTSQVLGKSTADGVLVQARSKQGTRCRGQIDGNSQPQALWVFSSDACGVYGISNVKIVHAGRSEPVGTIVLEMQRDNTKVRSASGMLLRVIS